ncbi:A/G-specific adenine glycosylase [Aquabacterium fontiphilum]|uniref:A/G-specific adenine glycosylase n=1 Tax=Aquabacterium fontiphilum TaxID=450365 RepID=UPI0013788807|nr:A/G-specific adenine glycosylase [Aquabacterium fontiphilum]NBD20928.1 A/G-specific adenine glycosylase [Aquabacterium fontiphilum]
MTLDLAQGLADRAQALSPFLADRLVAWQRQQGRHHLPWQQTRDPYRVWLSEIMLQQTQVSTVMGYYARFLERFPDVAALAAAPQDEVMALWAGLGYYSRARNLHRCAQVVVADHGGEFPRTAAGLQTLPGIGPSTASAIAAFCFGERISILDGNVKRVLSRVLAWEQDLAVKAHERALWEAAQRLLPATSQAMPAYTQGLMDLGATVCTPRQPMCLTCPWSDVCEGRRTGDPQRLPVKSRRLVRGQRENAWAWLVWSREDGPCLWLEQMPQTGLWAGLWTLPLFDDEAALRACLPEPCQGRVEAQPRFKHVLTHLDWWLQAHRVEVTDAEADCLTVMLRARPGAGGAGQWVAERDLARWGLPAAVRKVLTGA